MLSLIMDSELKASCMLCGEGLLKPPYVLRRLVLRRQ